MQPPPPGAEIEVLGQLYGLVLYFAQIAFFLAVLWAFRALWKIQQSLDEVKRALRAMQATPPAASIPPLEA